MTHPATRRRTVYSSQSTASDLLSRVAEPHSAAEGDDDAPTSSLLLALHEHASKLYAAQGLILPSLSRSNINGESAVYPPAVQRQLQAFRQRCAEDDRRLVDDVSTPAEAAEARRMLKAQWTLTYEGSKDKRKEGRRRRKKQQRRRVDPSASAGAGMDEDNNGEAGQREGEDGDETPVFVSAQPDALQATSDNDDAPSYSDGGSASASSDEADETLAEHDGRFYYPQAVLRDEKAASSPAYRDGRHLKDAVRATGWPDMEAKCDESALVALGALYISPSHRERVADA